MFLEKRYRSLNYELRNIFNKKMIKLSLDGGFTCPNRDGTCGTAGCIFCSDLGSGEFAGSRNQSITSQLKSQVALLSDKWKNCDYIAYFQNFSNTYDDIETLRKKYYEALNFEGVKGLAIATRADCINDEVVDLLNQISKTHLVWVEIGLQTIHESSATFLRRGYDLNTFEYALKKLNDANIKVVTHLIFGIPCETKADMMKSIEYISSKNIWGVKIHLLHILKNTDLATHYLKTSFKTLEKDEYISLVCDAIEKLNPNICIHRMTGDGSKEDLIAPIWSLNKRAVLNGIEKELKRRNSYQGIKYK